jgi:AraC-like DNA-binding protein
MTHVLPNFLIDNKSFNLTKIDELFCLRYETSTQNSTKFIRITMHSMILLLSGKKVISLDNQKMDLYPNDIALLVQNNYFMSERLFEKPPYKVIVIYFDDAFTLDFVKRYEINLKNSDVSEAIMIKNSDKLLQNNINMFENYLDEKIPNKLLKLKIEEIFLSLLHTNKKMMRSFFKAIVSTSKDRIEYILESNIDLVESVEDMATITRLSPASLREYIKTKHNCTPKSWLDTKRLNKAKMMIQNTDKSIKEISTECGYSTQSWFIAQFKKYYDCTPKEFRHNL